MLAQIPDQLRRGERGYVVPEPAAQWSRDRSVLDLVAEGNGGFRKLHFLVFPEGCLPLAHLDDMLATIERRLRASMVTMVGLEHVPLATFRTLLERFGEDNARALEFVDQDVESGSDESMPVNCSCVVVSEDDGKVRVFLQAKGHPFHGIPGQEPRPVPGAVGPPLPGHVRVQLHGSHLPRLSLPGPLLLEHPAPRRAGCASAPPHASITSTSRSTTSSTRGRPGSL